MYFISSLIINVKKDKTKVHVKERKNSISHLLFN